jgi:very-short-patch-repair endonuclease
MANTASQFGILHRLLEDARTRLIQADGRNRLIHTPRDAKRSKSLRIFEASADQVFRLLVTDRRPLTFVPAPDEEAENRSRKTRNGTALQTDLTAEGLQKRILGLYRDGKTLEEEQGVNILYLAIGFLRWFESENSETAREAPLILLPVSLARDSVRSSFRLLVRDEDISANLSLQERLREFGISLPPIPEEDEWRPADYFDAVRTAIAPERRWTIDDNGMFLGFFSFSKFLMFRDLDPSNWPDDRLLSHPIIAELLVDGFAHNEPLFPDDAQLDEIFDPADLIHVVDADASQAIAIETVRKGRNLVIQGPPGTGKSQTITNIIATAVHDGKKVLFVAEKMAALDVVHQRLVNNGLGEACLVLHSRHANKRAVIQQIEHTLRNSHVPTRVDHDTSRLRSTIAYLNKNAARLNTPLRPSGVTPFRALGEQVLLLAEGNSAPRRSIPDIADWTEEKTRAAIQSVKRLAELTSQYGTTLKHPWRGVNARGLQPADLTRLQADLRAFESFGGTVAKATSDIAEALGLVAPCAMGDFPKIIELLQVLEKRPSISVNLLKCLAIAPDLHRLTRTTTLGKTFKQLNRELTGVFSSAAWSTSFDDIRDAFLNGVDTWLKRLLRPYRRAVKKLATMLDVPMPKKPVDRLKLVETLMRAQELRQNIESDDLFCRACLGVSWRGLDTDFAALERGLVWIDSLKGLSIDLTLDKCVTFTGDPRRLIEIFGLMARRFVAESEELIKTVELDFNAAFGSDNIRVVPLDTFLSRIREWLIDFGRISEWTDLARADRLARDDGASAIADALAQEHLGSERAVGELRFTRAEAIWKAAIARDPPLADINGEDRSHLVEDFKKLETARRSAVAHEIQARHLASIPKGGQELLTIRHEIAKQRRHLATRQLVERASNALRDIKPVFLMSPISVAQFLPPGSIEFDLLVIDEASQVRPEDALGAIARAQQVVVVGDKKQLPPTSFFDRVLDDDGESEDDENEDVVRTTELESILSACEAQGMSSRMLTWHYRSRHPSLIEVSNDEFYDNKLFLPPSPATRERAGLTISRVNGSYDRGGKRTNQIEAEAVVSAITKHAREYSNLSLGVVTFSISQRDLIEDLLEQKRREDSELDDFISRVSREAMFVKNLENVQGDERDAIIISVGYGPRIAGSGLDSMHFGPVSTDGGERRLNVLFTRARVRCEVFASFSFGDIDLARTKKPGARVLKRFMKFAETGVLDAPLPAGDPDSPFEEAVGRYLRQLNYAFDFQVGSAGFRIDLAIKHPARTGEYILAVECDGATYHSARWARERDRLRQEVLENQGWRFHRIWSTDWFRNPDRAKAKLAEAIELAAIRAN